MIRNKKGITLIALIITIIVMLILAGIVITLTVGEDGIIHRAKQAGVETIKQEAIEKISFKISELQMDYNEKEQRNPTLQEIANALSNDEEIEYVSSSTKVATTEEVTTGEPQAIYTKLKGYNYEHEINGELKIVNTVLLGGNKEGGDNGGNDEPARLAAGLYDENGNMICTWEESGLDVSITYSSSSEYENFYQAAETSGYYVLTNKYPGVTKIVIPEGTVSIGHYCFKDCINLEEVDFPSSLETINNYAFSNCSSLKSLKISNNVSSIGYYCFKDCINLEEVDFPSSLETINGYAFSNCSSLKSLKIPNNVSSIGYHTFDNCTSLTTLYWPITVESNNSFNNCTALTDIHITKGSTGIGVDYTSSSYERTAWHQTMSNNPTITLEEGITYIGSYTFAYNTLTSIQLNNGLKEIGREAFRSCTKLKTIDLPDGFETLKEQVFINCSGLTSVKIPKSMVEIGAVAFCNCTSLKEIEIYGNIKTSAFSGCVNLNAVKLKNNVTNIGGQAFYKCSALNSVEFTQGVTNIEESAFQGCTSLNTIELPEGLTSIKSNAFSGCTGLTKVYIPKSVESILSSSSSGSNLDLYSPFYECSASLVIYCEVSSPLDTWGKYWNYYDSYKKLTVNYDTAREQFKNLT